MTNLLKLDASSLFEVILDEDTNEITIDIAKKLKDLNVNCVVNITPNVELLFNGGLIINSEHQLDLFANDDICIDSHRHKIFLNSQRCRYYNDKSLTYESKPKQKNQLVEKVLDLEEKVKRLEGLLKKTSTPVRFKGITHE